MSAPFAASLQLHGPGDPVAERSPRRRFSAVLAKSFARSFYRNAINNGLLGVECDTTAIAEGDRLTARVDVDGAVIEDVTRGPTATGRPLPRIMLTLLEYGGIVSFLKGCGGWEG